MSSIVANQRAVNRSLGCDAARSLARSMRNLSPPERAAIIALLAASTNTPVDVVLLGVRGDAELCASVLDGVLARGSTNTSWRIGSGCEFVLTILPREANHE